MNKADLIDRVAETTKLTKADVDRVLGSMFHEIGEALQNDEVVTLIGFGTFLVRKRKERTGRNPQTGLEIKIKASKLPAFRPGKALKDTVNHGGHQKDKK